MESVETSALSQNVPPASDPVPNAPAPRAETVSALGPMKALLLAMRPRQWAKNLLLFAGLLFTLQQAHPLSDFGRALAGFGIFCLLSGCTYLINDLLDIDADRQHPKKRLRPIASGQLSIASARAAALVGIPISLATGWFLGPKFLIAAACYLALTLLYSFRLKHEVLIDVLALASLFVLRAVAGAFAVGVPSSEWLLMCTLLLALFLGLAKRRGELAALGEKPATRPILAEYSLPMLDQMITITGAACVMAYTLYTFFSKTGQQRPYLMATVPFVLYGLFRYLYLSHRKGMGEAPETVLAEDRAMQINILLWALTALLAMRLGR